MHTTAPGGGAVGAAIVLVLPNLQLERSRQQPAYRSFADTVAVGRNQNMRGEGPKGLALPRAHDAVARLHRSTAPVQGCTMSPYGLFVFGCLLWPCDESAPIGEFWCMAVSCHMTSQIASLKVASRLCFCVVDKPRAASSRNNVSVWQAFSGLHLVKNVAGR